MEDLISWLNENSGAVSALSMIGTVLFTACAALAALVTLARSRRKERCNIDIYVNTSENLRDGSAANEPMVKICVTNLGPGRPLTMRFDFNRHAGDSIRTLRDVGDSETIMSPTVERCREWVRIRVSWLDPDGSQRTIRCWYRVEGDWAAPANQQRYLQLSRDDRASYLNSPRYLRRRLAPRQYLSWRKSQARSRQRLARQSDQ